MPCSLEAWEVEWERQQAEARRRAENADRFGLDASDARVATEAACRACRLLDSRGLMGEADGFLRRWWAAHQEQDRRRAAGAEGESVEAYIARTIREAGAP